MKTDILDLTSKIFKQILLAGALLYVVIYLVLVFYRIGYPFELEWEEGAMVDQVRRILAGQKLYVSPSLEFVASIYTPLYFYLSAAVSSIIGIGFISLRFISFIASIGNFFIIYLIVKRETGNTFPGIVASCLFAATFRISGAWFDVARVDSLFLFFLLTALYLVKFATSMKSYILAGVFITLSFSTKQTALIISLPIMLYSIYSSRRSALLFIGTVVLLTGGSTLILNYFHDSWYKYYLFDLPRQHPLVKDMFVDFWTKDILAPLPIAFILSVFYIFTQLLNLDKRNFLFYFFVSIGMLGGAWFSRLHAGGYINVLFPAYAIISILFGLAFHTVFQFMSGLAFSNKRSLLMVSLFLIYIAQFYFLKYNPLHQIPTKGDLEAGWKFINMMAQTEGEIFVPEHGYLPTMAGKKSYAFGMAIRDVLKGRDVPVKNKLINEIRHAIQEKKFSVIILDEFESHWQKNIENHYERKGTVFDNKTVFWPVSGLKNKRPDLIYVPHFNNIHKNPHR